MPPSSTFLPLTGEELSGNRLHKKATSSGWRCWIFFHFPFLFFIFVFGLKTHFPPPGNRNLGHVCIGIVSGSQRYKQSHLQLPHPWAPARGLLMLSMSLLHSCHLRSPQELADALQPAYIIFPKGSSATGFSLFLPVKH